MQEDVDEEVHADDVGKDDEAAQRVLPQDEDHLRMGCAVSGFGFMLFRKEGEGG